MSTALIKTPPRLISAITTLIAIILGLLLTSMPAHAAENASNTVNPLQLTDTAGIVAPPAPTLKKITKVTIPLVETNPGDTNAYTVSAATAQSYARSRMSTYDWNSSQFQCLVYLWNKESGWSTTANNASSGAYGIPQSLPGTKMATAGADWRTNYKTQINWGLDYINRAYGSPCAAWAHSGQTNWY